MAFNPARTEAPQQKITEQTWRLWNAVHAYVRQHGGAVVSIPGHREVRIEVPKDSTLPAKLVDLGYQPHHYCATSRITAGRFETVDVVSIMLPAR